MPRPIFDDIIEAVRIELERAESKFPDFNSAHEGYAIIKEELDELWETVRLKQSAPTRNSSLITEATQVAAMAIRFIKNLPEFHN